MDKILRDLTLDFLGKGKHKITPGKFFETQKGFFLDVRSKEEVDTMTIKLKHHENLECKNIPINEIPDRFDEVPRDKFVAIFCPASIRSAIVYVYLLSKGYSNMSILEGGYTALTEELKPGNVFKVIQD